MKNLHGEARTLRTQQELNTILVAHERYVAQQGGIRAQLAHSALDGLSLANRVLSEADFSGASLVNATLTGSNLQRASLYCSDLRGANLQHANLARADMRGAALKGANLANAVLDGADLRAAMMMYVGPGNVSVLDRNKNGDEPSGVDFSNCSLKNVSFANALLNGTDFSGALLQGAKFKGAKLTNVKFTGAVLAGVDLKDLNLPADALTGCILNVSDEMAARAPALKRALAQHYEWLQSGGKSGSPAKLEGQDLRPLKAEFAGRMLAALQAQNTLAIGIDFSGCQLQAAKFDGSDLRDADFRGADLRGASFRDTKLAHARFDGANLGRLPMANGTQLKPDFTGAEASLGQFEAVSLDEPLVDLGLSADT